MNVHEKPWRQLADEITTTIDKVESQSFEDVFGMLSTFDGRLFFSGQGRSGLIAQMAAMRLMHLGYRVHFIGEVTAPAISQGDCLVLVCGSGRTPTSKSFATVAKEAKSKVILFTRANDAAISALSDLVLRVPIQSSQQFGGSLFEQISLLLLDALAQRIEREGAVSRDLMWGRHTNMQ